MDQYNDTVQHPQTAFSDPVLKAAKIATNGMGLPIALGGGFALTYTASAQGRKFAIRCFHKQANGLEARYGHVDQALRAAGGPYFVGFEYQPSGVLVNGTRYPIVKMDWVEGDTLGSFLEDNYSNRARLEQLRAQFTELERFLRSKGLAHGDLQNGNVLVKSGLKLIDYDGIYVPALPTGRGAELGHKHFQHPKRSAADFGPEMDRFSFIVLDLSLRALASNPKLFSRYSNGENIILTANDFIDPGGSAAFAEMKAVPTLARDTMSLASICAAPVKSVPTLDDFLAARNIPAAAIIIRPPSGANEVKKEATYVGAYDVVDATKYAMVERQVGNRVELVGRVTKVHLGKTRYGRHFCFVFFLDQSRQAVKLNIWSDGLAKLAAAPSEAWVGSWLSIQGLIDPVYVSGKYGASLSITITSNSQLRKITETEAGHRLGGAGTATGGTTSNRDILAGLGNAGPSSAGRAKQAPASPRTTNQAILRSIQRGGASTPSPSHRSSTPAPGTPSKQDSSWGCIILAAIAVVVAILTWR